MDNFIIYIYNGNYMEKKLVQKKYGHICLVICSLFSVKMDFYG